MDEGGDLSSLLRGPSTEISQAFLSDERQETAWD